MLIVNLKWVLDEKMGMTRTLLEEAMKDPSKKDEVKAKINAIEDLYKAISKHTIEIE